MRLELRKERDGEGVRSLLCFIEDFSLSLRFMEERKADLFAESASGATGGAVLSKKEPRRWSAGVRRAGDAGGS